MSATTRILASAALIALAGGATSVQAEQGDLLVRVRGIMVAPQDSSSGINPAFPTEKVKVNNAITPEVDITKMLTDNIGVELIAATTQHTVSGTSGATGTLGKLVKTGVLPPTLTVQYHLMPGSKVRPYVGAGLNYTMFYNERATTPLEGAVGPTKVNLSNSVGWAAQAGVDFDINERMFLNVDVKYIAIDTKAKLTTTAAGVQTVKVDINPLVIGVGVGFKL